MEADPEAFEAMVTPMLQMFEAALPEVEEVKSEPGILVEKILKDVLGTSPLYPMVRKFILNQVEEDPVTAEQTLKTLRDRLNQWREPEIIEDLKWRLHQCQEAD